MKIISNDKIVMKEVRIPTGDSIGGIPVVWAEKEIDIDATLQAQLDAGREEVKEIFEEIASISSVDNMMVQIPWLLYQALKQKHLGG